jgi:hypothetical protein
MAHLQRLIPLLASTLLPFTVACGDSAEPARFADATPEQLEHALHVAQGGDRDIALRFAAGFAGGNAPDACPSVVTDGDVTTVTGGCVDENGERVEGSIVIENMNGILAPDRDPTRPGRAVFDELVTIGDDGAELVLDGTVELNPTNPVLVVDLAVTTGDARTVSDLSLHCDDDGICELGDGSAIELDGLGAATIEGLWSTTLPIGAVFVHGADTVIFDISASEGTGCVDYHLDDGTVGQLCRD